MWGIGMVITSSRISLTSISGCDGGKKELTPPVGVDYEAEVLVDKRF
jgi:hypothetical protein